MKRPRTSSRSCSTRAPSSARSSASPARECRSRPAILSRSIFCPRGCEALSSHFDEVRARVIPANVHDSILMLVNGNCELMFAYHHPELPLHLDPTRYEYLTVGADTFMPVCKPNQRSAPAFRLPGTNDRPLPLISYTETSYFGRCLAVLLGHAKAAPALRLSLRIGHGGSGQETGSGRRRSRVAAEKLHPRRTRHRRPRAGRDGRVATRSRASGVPGCVEPQRVSRIALAPSSRRFPASPDRVVPRYAKLA